MSKKVLTHSATPNGGIKKFLWLIYHIPGWKCKKCTGGSKPLAPRNPDDRIRICIYNQNDKS